jgi:hypothetical protein
VENVTGRRWDWLKWALGAVLAAACLAGLYLFVPGESGFYPRCGLYWLTGLQCPGCGGLRAAHQLLHGNVAAGFRYNPLVVLLVPGLAAWGAAWLIRRAGGRDWAAPFRRPVFVWLLLAALIAFGILRNVPFARLAGPTP